MAKQYQVQADQITPGVNIILRGKVDFSNIATVITGEELIKKNQQRERNNLSPIEADSYTSISIRDAVVQQQDPNQMSLEEFYINERLYRPKADGKPNAREGEPFYTVINRGDRLPSTAWVDPVTNKATPLVLPHELAKGVEVILILNVFKTKRNNRGIGLNSVFIMGEPEYYIPGAVNVDADVLSHLGITMDSQEAAAPVATANPALAANTEVRDGHALPAAELQTPSAPALTPEQQHIAELKAQIAAAQAAAAQPQAPVAQAPVAQAVPVTPPVSTPGASAFTTPPQVADALPALNTPMPVEDNDPTNPWGTTPTGLNPEGINYQG